MKHPRCGYIEVTLDFRNFASHPMIRLRGGLKFGYSRLSLKGSSYFLYSVKALVYLFFLHVCKQFAGSIDRMAFIHQLVVRTPLDQARHKKCTLQSDVACSSFPSFSDALPWLSFICIWLVFGDMGREVFLLS